METADVKAFFDEVASDWDTMRLTYYDERVIEQLAARTELTGEQTVVDVGTGTGFVAAGLSAHAHRVLGYDNSPSMLEVARANLDRLGIDNVELAEGDVAHLPLADDAVDATVANMVLHHATDPAAMIADMVRVTRPGGWIAITDAPARHSVKHPIHDLGRSRRHRHFHRVGPGDLVTRIARGGECQVVVGERTLASRRARCWADCVRNWATA